MKEIVETIKKTLNEDVTSIVFYNGGITNDNYVINDKYMLRRKKNYTQPFYDSVNEIEIENKIKDQNITIPFLYIDENFKITTFIHNSIDLSYFININNDALISIANKLRKLHSIDYVAKNDFMPFRRIEEYLDQSGMAKLSYHDEIINKMKPYYKDAKLCLCHNDLVPGNILFFNHKFFLIDFEYAGNNLPFFDVISFLSENNIEDKEKQDLFINTYYQSNVPENIEEMKQDFFNFLDLLWFYWAVMMFKTANEDIYLEIAKLKITRLNKYFKVEEQ